VKATPLLDDKRAFGPGFIQIMVWVVPEPVPPSEHPYKYRLVYVRDGKRAVGYDNERGKGDHRHLGEREMPYVFVDVATLLRDFWNDVQEAAI
jgi:Family of unknown function (DUF6516)